MCGMCFVRAREPIHLNGLQCPVTRREEVPAFLKTQPEREPRFPVWLCFPVRVACH
ncbi:unnamed protein product [Staurois parvus]|uniref:Uncharacterized protein n=1 Tax=Staurois parvus TaxID=386267 RepID=A0ABN9AP18_9NEOB|nr:unnamed protein product [Staurois parvus]